jgi:hypothetical protein
MKLFAIAGSLDRLRGADVAKRPAGGPERKGNELILQLVDWSSTERLAVEGHSFSTCGVIASGGG